LNIEQADGPAIVVGDTRHAQAGDPAEPARGLAELIEESR
jgi:hypothetical protein